MKYLRTYVFGLVILACGIETKGQGTFQNLDFESANPVSAGNPADPNQVTFASAFPGWTGYLGTTQTTLALYNDSTLGLASIDLYGPGEPDVIQGQYTAVLQPGLDPFGSGQYVSASISQSGLVPASAVSLQFKASFVSTLSITLGGQNLSLTAWGSGPNYTDYAANIPSSEVGQMETLNITASGMFGINTIDAFEFSTQSVPEPNPFALTGVGGLLFALYRRFAPKRCL
jgi:hypothetical protein